MSLIQILKNELLDLKFNSLYQFKNYFKRIHQNTIEYIFKENLSKKFNIRLIDLIDSTSLRSLVKESFRIIYKSEEEEYSSVYYLKNTPIEYSIQQLDDNLIQLALKKEVNNITHINSISIDLNTNIFYSTLNTKQITNIVIINHFNDFMFTNERSEVESEY